MEQALAAPGVPEIEKVLSEALTVLERSRQELFGIAEQARTEYEELRRELTAVRQQVQEQIERVEELTREDRACRARLLQVSRAFHRFTQEEVRAAYEQARDVQVRLHVALERERHLRSLRDSLERRLRRVALTLGRAEELVSKAGLALELLGGNLRELSQHVQGLRARQALAYSIIRAQEEERRRVAREIHDGPAQLLANVAFRLELCEHLIDKDLEQLRQEIRKLREAVRQSLQDVRSIIFDLRPMAIDDLGLIPALRGYAATFTDRTGLRVEFEGRGKQGRLPAAVEIAALRLVQEALNNVWKHAGATTARVTVEVGEENLRIWVEDDGKGFDIDEVMSVPGERFGLLTMRERVDLLRGELSIDSAPGRGTTVRITLPLASRGDSR